MYNYTFGITFILFCFVCFVMLVRETYARFIFARDFYIFKQQVRSIDQDDLVETKKKKLEKNEQVRREKEALELLKKEKRRVSKQNLSKNHFHTFFSQSHTSTFVSLFIQFLTRLHLLLHLTILNLYQNHPSNIHFIIVMIHSFLCCCCCDCLLLLFIVHQPLQ